MTFREQALLDLPTFLNSDEFGETRVIDGAPVPSVLTSEALEEHAAEGVYVSTSLLHVRVTDLVAVPVVGQRMVIDGQQADVVHVDDEQGMLVIRLRWFES